MQTNPYADDLGDRDPYQALGETPRRIATIVEGWNDAQLERTYAPGKWTARQILVHLAQIELGLSTRARFALTANDYTAEAFDQDAWMPLDEPTDARTALGAYLALRAFNLAMWKRLSPQQRQRPFAHPEFGELNVDWIAAQLAGHDIHHLKQFEAIAGNR
jgi:hypothetical protein